MFRPFRAFSEYYADASGPELFFFVLAVVLMASAVVGQVYRADATPDAPHVGSKARAIAIRAK